MHKLFPVTEADTQIAVELPSDDGTLKVHLDDATDLSLLYTQSAKDCDYAEGYEKFRIALENRWGVKVTKATAYMTVELVSKIITELKKTFTASASSKS